MAQTIISDGDKLRDVRNSLFLSVAALYTCMGVNEKTVRRLEAGCRTTSGTLARAAKCLLKDAMRWREFAVGGEAVRQCAEVAGKMVDVNSVDDPGEWNEPEILCLQVDDKWYKESQAHRDAICKKLGTVSQKLKLVKVEVASFTFLFRVEAGDVAALLQAVASQEGVTKANTSKVIEKTEAIDELTKREQKALGLDKRKPLQGTGAGVEDDISPLDSEEDAIFGEMQKSMKAAGIIGA